MIISRKLFDWFVTNQVLTVEHAYSLHKARDASEIKLVPAAVQAVVSGHVMYYACFNIALQNSVQIDVALEGVPGEWCPKEQLARNWDHIFQILTTMGYPLDKKCGHLTVAIKGGENLTALAEFLEIITDFLENPTSSQSEAHTPPPPGTVAGDIDIARRRYQRKVEERHREQRQKELEYLEEQRLRKMMTKSLDFERFRTKNTLPIRTAPIFHEFQNRGAVMSCLQIVDDIVSKVVSGEAQQEIRMEERQKSRTRELSQKRKLVGARMVDIKPVIQLPPHMDHRIAMMAKSIVMEIVHDSVQPDIVEVLMARDTARAKSIKIMEELARRERERQNEPPQLPLRIRLEREKAKKIQDEQDASRAMDAKMAEWRKMNRMRAIESHKVSIPDQQRKAEEQHQEQLQKQKYEEERQEHFRQVRMQIEMRKLVQLAEQRADSMFESETAIRSKIVERFQNEVNGILHSPEKEEPDMTLSASSFASGDKARYVGDTFGEQFLTEFEASIFEQLCEIRSEPLNACQFLKRAQEQMSTTKTMWFGSGSNKEPMLVKEGGEAVAECLKVIQRQRPTKPFSPTVSIALTLAARQHAADMAFHGIAHSRAHTGTDRSALTVRISRFGSYTENSGCQEMMFGVVRPDWVPITAKDVIYSWLVDDGEQDRASRRAFFTPGNAAATVGIGHGKALRNDRIVDVVCLLLAHPFTDKTASQMAKAQNRAFQALTPSFLNGIHEVDSNVSLKVLYGAPNATIGRIVALPNLKLLTLEKKRKNQLMSDVLAGEEVYPSPKKDSAKSKSNHKPPRLLQPLSPSSMIGSEEFQPVDVNKKPSSEKRNLAPLKYQPALPPYEEKRQRQSNNTVPSQNAVKKEPDVSSPSKVLAKTTPVQKQSVSPTPKKSAGAKQSAIIAAQKSQTCEDGTAEVKKDESRVKENPEKAKTPDEHEEASKVEEKPSFTQFKETEKPMYPRCVVKAVGLFLLMLKRKRRIDLADRMEDEAVQLEKQYSATMIQLLHKAAVSQSVLKVKYEDRFVSQTESKVASVRQERQFAALSITAFMFRIMRANQRARRQFEQKLEEVRYGVVQPLIEDIVDVAMECIKSLIWKDRILALYQLHIPDKLSSLETMLRRYQGREDVLLQALVEKYGPEELYELRLTQFYHRYCQEKVPEVKTILVKYAAHEDELFAALETKYGPEPPMYPDAVMRFAMTLLTRIKKNEPRRRAKSKRKSEAQDHQDFLAADYAVSMIQRFVRRKLFKWAVRKEMSVVQRLTYKQRLTRFYQMHNPEKLDTVDSILVKYSGVEEELFQALVNKYGPEM